MTKEIVQVVAVLKTRQWKVEPTGQPVTTPAVIQKRYAWIPSDVRDAIVAFDAFSNPGDTAWFLTHRDYSGASDSAYAWNEWELQCLSAAKGDKEWESSISRFWDEHFPILLSVKSGYGFFALRRSDSFVVAGAEPEFEEVQVVAGSYLELLKALGSEGDKYSRWV